MQHHARQNACQQGLHYGQLILRHDPLREEIHRQIMRLHWRAGERDRAVRQYHLCREVLAAELGIPPMPETEALFAQIVAGAEEVDPPGQPPAAPPTSASLQEALNSIADARARLDAARRDLNRAERLVLEWQAGTGVERTDSNG
jgi:DNA-binding SARP family transcriptional activator